MKKILFLLITLVSLNCYAQKPKSGVRSAKSVYEQNQSELNQFEDKIVKLKVALQHQDLTVVNMLQAELISDMKRELEQEKLRLTEHNKSKLQSYARIMREQAEEEPVTYYGQTPNPDLLEQDRLAKNQYVQLDESINSVSSINDSNTKFIKKNIQRQGQIIEILDIYEFNTQSVEDPGNGSHVALIEEFELLMKSNTNRELRKIREEAKR